MNPLKMEPSYTEEQLSDDEIFFGKLSLKELKKHILWNKYPHNKNPEHAESQSNHNYSINIKTEIESMNENDDFGAKIIESHSEPNLRSFKNCHGNSSEFSSPCARPSSDDSFIKIENMVDNLCISNNGDTNVELNNTLDVINYILNNGKECKTDDEIKVENEANEKECSEVVRIVKSPEKTILSPSKLTNKTNRGIKTSPNSPDYITPIKTESNTPYNTNIFKTPISNRKIENFATPLTNLKYKPTGFKTPAPVLQKKQNATSLKKTPSKSNSYQHISSPVASYIKNCPQVPLLKDVHPKKPLPGPSSIPKLTKCAPKNNAGNKENILLPSVAYKSAKRTKMIEVPDEEKLPQTQWVKKMTSTLPKPVIMKHNHREMDVAKRSLMQEESFADLPYRQAELSVCTQKTAFKLNKN